MLVEPHQAGLAFTVVASPMGLATDSSTYRPLDNGILNSRKYKPCCAGILAMASDEPSRSGFVRRCHMLWAPGQVCSMPCWPVLVFLYMSEPRQSGVRIECGMAPITQGGPAGSPTALHGACVIHQL